MLISPIDWAQLSRFHLKTETESSLRNVVGVLNTSRKTDNVQKHNICINVPSSQILDIKEFYFVEYVREFRFTRNTDGAIKQARKVYTKYSCYACRT
jgi:hypothetical protein